MNDKDFEKLVEDALKGIPGEFLEKLKNVDVSVQDVPSLQQIGRLRTRGEWGFLLGLYEGVPQTKRQYYGIGGQLPDKITIFKMPILALAQSKDHLTEIIRSTVVHEIGHHFGMSEDQIRNAERMKALPLGT